MIWPESEERGYREIYLLASEAKRCILIGKHAHSIFEITFLRNTRCNIRITFRTTGGATSGRATTFRHSTRRAETSGHGSVGARASSSDAGCEHRCASV